MRTAVVSLLICLAGLWGPPGVMGSDPDTLRHFDYHGERGVLVEHDFYWGYGVRFVTGAPGWEVQEILLWYTTFPQGPIQVSLTRDQVDEPGATYFDTTLTVSTIMDSAGDIEGVQVVDLSAHPLTVDSAFWVVVGDTTLKPSIMFTGTAPPGPPWYNFLLSDDLGWVGGRAELWIAAVAQRLQAVGVQGPAPVSEGPRIFLAPNTPNPFNPSTVIRYGVPEGPPLAVRLEIFSARGALVRRLVEEQKAPGSYAVAWDGRDDQGRPLPSGLYIYRLRVGESVQARKMLLAR